MDMNLNLSHSANELADWLVYFTQDAADYEEKNVLEAATMLRQQQERIEELTDWMCSIHLFLESTCGEEFTAEVFRKPPDTVGVIYEY